jgi:hypothetical protein
VCYRRDAIANAHERLTVQKTSIALIAALLLSLHPGAARADSLGPADVEHALYLQTQGLLASMAVVEPCNTAGMADAVNRANSAYENQDALSLSTQQGSYAVGFANCALHATTTADFATFAGATVQSGVTALDGRKAMGMIEPIDHAHARQLYLVAKWLLGAKSADKIVKSIAKVQIAKLHSLHLV